MTEKYPFVFAGHGPLEADYIGKCSEVCLWFEEPVAPALIKKFQTSAPKALSWFMCATDRFIYFGSQGDTFDADIAAEFGSPKSKALLKDFETDFDNDGWHAYRDATNDEFDEILDRFADALESWAIEVHKDAPIAFFAGPDGASSDWHEWSVSQLADVAYPLIAAYEESGPDLDRIDRKVLGNDENKSNQEAAAFIMKHVGWCRSVVESHAA